MTYFVKFSVLASLCLHLLVGLFLQTKPSTEKVEATSIPTMQYPTDYRKWIYLSSGIDMSYSATASPDHHMFDNVFVNPEAYEAFLKTGTWPDKTTFVLELRGSKEKGSINRRGSYQSESMGIEVHARDDKRFPGGWGFFEFNGTNSSQMVPPTAQCYSCHAAHGAVNTTFVQFYPTLLPIANEKGTLSKAYRAE